VDRISAILAGVGWITDCLAMGSICETAKINNSAFWSLPLGSWSYNIRKNDRLSNKFTHIPNILGVPVLEDRELLK
jgi:hypothetical protein